MIRPASPATFSRDAGEGLGFPCGSTPSTSFFRPNTSRLRRPTRAEGVRIRGDAISNLAIRASASSFCSCGPAGRRLHSGFHGACGFLVVVFVDRGRGPSVAIRVRFRSVFSALAAVPLVDRSRIQVSMSSTENRRLRVPHRTTGISPALTHPITRNELT